MGNSRFSTERAPLKNLLEWLTCSKLTEGTK